MAGCGSRQDLTCDHIIPVSDPLGATLAYEPLNVRVLCRRHNAAKGATCSDVERAVVLAKIAARRGRVTAA
ncbi:HNH endonuclease signature motif containing protein [Mycolicibacterium neoaurum]|uniref:HNH endonuclease signature motif containing protein n=1 Tax=Mycolicibacterium neoaurum TaxID=1795 RepID=UPI0034D584B5